MAKQNKPAIRFKEFTDAWEQRKLGEIVEIKDSARIPNNEWSDIGVPYIRASDISSKNLKGTLFISSERYEFYKNKTGAPMRGDVLFNGGGEIGKSIICNDSKPIYVQGGAVLYARTSASNKLEASYLKTYYETSHSRKYIDAASAGGTMKHFTLKPAQEMPVYLPEAEEQKQIGDFYICIDNLITLHQRKYDKLQVLKKAMLEKMFPKNGSSVPEIRFKGFTDAWEQRKLGEIVEIKDSARIPNNEWSDIGVPYIRASDISSKNLKGTLFISSERYEFYKNKTGAPMRGDVLFNGGGEIGKSIICNDSKPIYVQGGAVLYARTSASNKLEASYLKTYYETSHSRKYIDAASAGGTMKHFTLKPAQEMPVYLPEAEEQKQIGDFYICIDNLITLHQRKYDKLQVLKKAMLEKMFPKNGSSVPEIRFKGFTDAWEQRKLGDFCEMFNGDRSAKYPNEQDMVHEGIPFINAGDLENGCVNLLNANKITTEKYNDLGGAKLQLGDIVYCLRGTLGKNAYIDNFSEGTVASSLVAIRPKNIDGKYLFYILNSDIEYSQRILHDEGAAQPNLSAKSVSEFIIPIPNIDEQKKLSSFFDSLSNLITLHQRELEKLQNIKKSMLEKMFV